MDDEDKLLEKTFPYFVVWHDNGDALPCSGICHGRTLEEAAALAEQRVIHGSFESVASMYFGSVNGKASLVRRYRWQELKVVYEQTRRT
jgi:hypothetical protein